MSGAMVLFSTRPVRIQPYFGYRSSTRLVLRARALRSRKARFDRQGRLGAVRTMLEQFVSHEVAGIAVTLEVPGPDALLLSATQKTDREGFVLFDLPLDPAWDMPPHPAWETVHLHWITGEGPQCVDAHVLAPGRDSNLAVISDIDDTIIETGITGGLRSVARNWRRVLAQMPEERIAAPGADVFYGTLGGGQVLPQGEVRASERIAATHRPFFYVSSSPWNLFSYLVAFMRTRGLPLGPIMLRDWGLDRSTFGSASHGLHKRGAIDAILATFPHLRFALIGDDTQGDLIAFAGVVADHPDRIAAVFVRTSSGQAFSSGEEAARAAIEAAGVPLWLGDSYAIGEDFLHALGFTPGGETEQIVRAVEGVAQSDEVTVDTER